MENVMRTRHSPVDSIAMIVVILLASFLILAFGLTSPLEPRV
jgi:hypothetical protein